MFKALFLETVSIRDFVIACVIVMLYTSKVALICQHMHSSNHSLVRSSVCPWRTVGCQLTGNWQRNGWEFGKWERPREAAWGLKRKGGDEFGDIREGGWRITPASEILVPMRRAGSPSLTPIKINTIQRNKESITWQGQRSRDEARSAGAVPSQCSLTVTAADWVEQGTVQLLPALSYPLAWQPLSLDFISDP